MQHVKQDSSKWVNNKKYVHGKFSWQSGYGAFSYSKSDVLNVIEYIKKRGFIINQKHFKRSTYNY